MAGSRQVGRGRGSRWLSEGRQAAAVRYSPAHQALAEALLNARQTYGQSVQSARSAGTMTVQTAKAQLPAVQGAYDSARQNEEASAALAQAELAKLPDSPFKALRQTEVNTQLSNLLKGKASDEGRIASQQVAAREGSQFAQHQARQALQSTIGQLIAKAQALGGEEGQFAVVEANKLQHEADKIQAGENASIRSSKTSLANAALGAETARGAYSYTHGGKGSSGRGGGGVGGWLSPDKQSAAASTLREIEHDAREARAEGVPRHLIYEELTSAGGGKNVVKKDANGHPILNTKGEKQYEKTPELKAHDALLTQAALDSVFGYGHVSHPVATKLHQAGYRISALGLVPTTHYKQAPENIGGVHGTAQNKSKRR